MKPPECIKATPLLLPLWIPLDGPSHSYFPNDQTTLAFKYASQVKIQPMILLLQPPCARITGKLHHGWPCWLLSDGLRTFFPLWSCFLSTLPVVVQL